MTDKKPYTGRETVHAMQRLTLALMALTFSVPVAAEWVKVSEARTATLYVDPDTIRKEGDFGKVWQLADYRVQSAQGSLSRRSQSEYDCQREMVRILYVSHHSGRMLEGKTLSLDVNPDPDNSWVPVPPNTTDSIILKMLCAK